MYVKRRETIILRDNNRRRHGREKRSEYLKGQSRALTSTSIIRETASPYKLLICEGMLMSLEIGSTSVDQAVI